MLIVLEKISAVEGFAVRFVPVALVDFVALVAAVVAVVAVVYRSASFVVPVYSFVHVCVHLAVVVQEMLVFVAAELVLVVGLQSLVVD